MQSDPIGLYGGVNTYAYVFQNPLTNVDVMGTSVSWGGIIAVSVGAVTLYLFNREVEECERIEQEKVETCVKRMNQAMQNLPNLNAYTEYVSAMNDYEAAYNEKRRCAFRVGQRAWNTLNSGLGSVLNPLGGFNQWYQWAKSLF